MILKRESKEEKEELPDYEKNRMKNIQEQKISSKTKYRHIF